MTKMLWSVTTVSVVTVMCLLPDLVSAQPPGQRTMARNAWRWHSPVQQGRNFTFNLQGGSTFSPFGGYYGYGGLYGYGAPYGYGVPFGYGTPFGYDTLYGAPSAYGSDWTPPASPLSIEQAREQYLKNQAYYYEMKQKQREVIETRRKKGRRTPCPQNGAYGEATHRLVPTTDRAPDEFSDGRSSVAGKFIESRV